MQQDEIAALGASLHRISQKLLKSDEVGNTIRVWYQGEEPYFDIFFDFQDHQLIWFQLTFRGKFVTWSRESNDFQTGTTNELQVNDIGYYPASKIVTSDPQTDWDFIRLAYLILQTRINEPVFAEVLALFDEKHHQN